MKNDFNCNFRDKTLLWLAAIIIAQHLLFLAFFPPILEPDSVSYISLGRQLADTFSFESGRRLPGYPALLALCYGLFGQSQMPVVIFQHLLGLAIYFMFLPLVPGRRAKIFFSSFVFCDILFTSYQHALLPETVFAFLLCAAGFEFRNYATTGKGLHLLLCGTLLAAGTFMKPVLKLFPFLILLLLLAGRRTTRQKLAASALFLCVPLLSVWAWSYNNYRHKGVFALLPFESVHYVGRFVTHLEFPEGSFARRAFLDKIAAFPPSMPIEAQRRLAASVIAELKQEKNLNDGEINAEFVRIAKLSMLRHPFIYAKETLIEAFYFFFSAHNLYAKYALKDRLLFSVKDGLRNRQYLSVLLKVGVSLHPLYWLMFLLAVYFTVCNWRAIISGSNPLLNYAYAAIFYITALSCLVNEGLSRYRMPLQPFMILMATLALERLFARKIQLNFSGRLKDEG
ncbi:MAG: glycosyltransferase family 39 protein [Elusimicrobia bacterium]|nr:glycosyltransferase family 39 protein [Elusimicrobiota bacterium]